MSAESSASRAAAGVEARLYRLSLWTRPSSHASRTVKTESRMLTIETTSAPRNAAQKPSTWKPMPRDEERALVRRDHGVDDEAEETERQNEKRAREKGRRGRRGRSRGRRRARRGGGLTPLPRRVTPGTICVATQSAAALMRSRARASARYHSALRITGDPEQHDHAVDDRPVTDPKEHPGGRPAVETESRAGPPGRPAPPDSSADPQFKDSADCWRDPEWKPGPIVSRSLLARAAFTAV